MDDSFMTTNKHDYNWPFSRPIVPRPAQPPIATKKKNFFLQGPVEAYCHCDSHENEPLMNRYNSLAAKELALLENLNELHLEMTILVNEMLDRPCGTDDEKMQSIYQTDYVKRGLNLVEYIKLMPAVDSPIGMPVKEQVLSLGDGWRDPTRFRYSCFPRPNIDSCPCVSFHTTPANLKRYFEPTTGRTEYQDTISKVGLAITKARQQYTEPLPSSRRRYGDPCL